MRVCHVGAERPYTQQDLLRRLQALVVTAFDWRTAEEDVVNLLYGRDFLTETKTYDAVLVHSVFHTNHPTMLDATIKDAVLAGPSKAIIPISPEHSLKTWRNRLKSTEAQHILVFESQPVSLTAWSLGDLEGYSLEFPDTRVGWYQRAP